MSDELKDALDQSLALRSTGLARQGLHLAEDLVGASASRPAVAPGVRDRRRKLLRRLAQQGDVEAQFQLGENLAEEEGDEGKLPGWSNFLPEIRTAESLAAFEASEPGTRLKEIRHWYSVAAEHGHVEAMYRLAFWSDPWSDQGDLWVRKAAELGHAEAQCDLAMELFNGQLHLRRGIRWSEGTDPKEAFRWFSNAAEQGHVLAQLYLGHQYFEGVGVKRNPEQALRWWRTAAERGNYSAQCRLAEMNAVGLGVEEAFRWSSIAAEKGDGFAQCLLAEMYAQGQWVARNLVEASKWRRKAWVLAVELNHRPLRQRVERTGELLKQIKDEESSRSQASVHPAE